MKYFSAQRLNFLPAAWKKTYESAGTWPADAVEVTDEEWQTYGGDPPAGMRRGADESGRPCWVDLPAPSLDDLAAAAIARINAGYNKAMAPIISQYPDIETLSFGKQETQADAWWEWHDPAGNNQVGPEPVTPYLDSMLITRPIGKRELVTRIRDKAARFSDAHGQATGRRQALEDNVKAALTTEARATLEAIDW